MLRKKNVNSLLFYICIFFAFSFLASGAVAADSAFSAGAVSPVSDGIYENNRKFIVVKDSVPVSESLKLFNTFYYDKERSLEEDFEPFLACEIDDSVYLDFYVNYNGSAVWIPGSNLVELELTEYRKKERIYAYCFAADSVYRIPYWQCDTEYESSEAFFTSDEGGQFYLPKKIQFGSVVYTCATGKRTKIRNPEKLGAVPEVRYNADKTCFVLGTPYLVKLQDSSSLEKIISDRNSIVYPPRFSKIDCREPSIYAYLEKMKIE